jgi:hypothetical protein
MHSLCNPGWRTAHVRRPAADRDCSHMTCFPIQLLHQLRDFSSCFTAQRSPRSEAVSTHERHAAQDLQRTESSALPGTASMREWKCTVARHSTPALLQVVTPHSSSALHSAADCGARARIAPALLQARNQVCHNTPAVSASAARAQRHSLQVAAEHNARSVMGAAPARTSSGSSQRSIPSVKRGSEPQRLRRALAPANTPRAKHIATTR